MSVSPSGAPRNEAPASRAAGADPDDLAVTGEWDDQARDTPVQGHYDYAFLLRADRRLYLYFLIALLPLPYTLVELFVAVLQPRAGLMALGSGCFDLTGLAAAFLLQRWPGVAALVGYCLFALLQVLALVSDMPMALFGLAGLGLLALSFGAFLFYRDMKDQLRHRRYPLEVRAMAGKLSQFFALRAWVQLQREADQAEQSSGWQGAPQQPADDWSH